MLFLLCRRMEQGGTYIPLQHSPSLNTIARFSGWSKRHVQRALNELEQLELVIRTRPSKENAQKHHARTGYAVNVPLLLQLARDKAAQEARDRQSPGLGTSSPKARDTASHGLETGRRGARDTMAHSQTLSVQPDHPDPEIALIQGLLAVRTGVHVSDEWAAKTRQLLLVRPGAAERPAEYIRRTLTTDPNPQRWLPTPAPPQYQREESP